MKHYIKAVAVQGKAQGLIDDEHTTSGTTYSSEKIEGELNIINNRFEPLVTPAYYSSNTSYWYCLCQCGLGKPSPTGSHIYGYAVYEIICSRHTHSGSFAKYLVTACDYTGYATAIARATIVNLNASASYPTNLKVSIDSQRRLWVQGNTDYLGTMTINQVHLYNMNPINQLGSLSAFGTVVDFTEDATLTADGQVKGTVTTIMS